MINIPTMVKTVERVVRIVPFVKDLIPSNKDGLNSLIDAPAYKIRKLEDALHDKKAEICKLRENIKELEQVLIITHDQLKDAQNKIELLQETIGGDQS